MKIELGENATKLLAGLLLAVATIGLCLVITDPETRKNILQGAVALAILVFLLA